jgi:TetR/AcrR family transcriptional regulator
MNQEIVIPHNDIDDAAIKSPRWERRKESRPKELLAAALDVFVDKGYAAARLEDVANNAGVSKGTLYLYFKNKEDLFKTVLQESIIPLINQFADEVKDSALGCDDLIRLFFQQWWIRFGSTKLSGICKLMTAEAGNFPELATFFQQEIIEQNNRLLGSLVQRGIDAGEYKVARLDLALHLWMAPLVMHTVWCNSVGRCLPERPFGDEEYVAQHIEFVLATLKSPIHPSLPYGGEQLSS